MFYKLISPVSGEALAQSQVQARRIQADNEEIASMDEEQLPQDGYADLPVEPVMATPASSAVPTPYIEKERVDAVKAAEAEAKARYDDEHQDEATPEGFDDEAKGGGDEANDDGVAQGFDDDEPEDRASDNPKADEDEDEDDNGVPQGFDPDEPDDNAEDDKEAGAVGAGSTVPRGSQARLQTLVSEANSKGWKVVMVGPEKIKDYAGMNSIVAVKLGYPTTPNTIEIDGSMPLGKQCQTLKHELDEVGTMQQGVPYWPAHNQALQTENQIPVASRAVVKYGFGANKAKKRRRSSPSIGAFNP
jgi:hypothetical protein